MNNFWNTISSLGLDEKNDAKRPDQKRLMFFNQVLFIGFFATLFQIAFVWPFIGTQALVFLVVCAALIISLFLNSKSMFKLSKWIYVLVVYSMGVLTTLLLGGSSLYHIQCVLIFMSCLILFDHQKEKAQILIGLPFVIACIAIGEYYLLNVPDFSSHWWNETARVANISSLFSISFLLVNFIIRLNARNESDLTEALSKVQKGNDELEEIVKIRTAKLSEHKELLEHQNEEKEILLKEIHHRVKNNLQVIISMIRLNMYSTENQDTKGVLQEIQNKVRSMSFVHEKMYQTSNFKEIPLKDYTKSIIKNISQIYSDQSFESIVDIPDDMNLKLDAAIPTGLIINEMVSNFFKHGLNEEGSDSSFKISLDSKDGEHFLLKFSDNGKGFSANFNNSDSGSLGMTLIESLSNQLSGKLHCYTDNGAVYEISELELH